MSDELEAAQMRRQTEEKLAAARALSEDVEQELLTLEKLRFERDEELAKKEETLLAVKNLQARAAMLREEIVDTPIDQLKAEVAELEVGWARKSDEPWVGYEGESLGFDHLGFKSWFWPLDGVLISYQIYMLKPGQWFIFLSPQEQLQRQEEIVVQKQDRFTELQRQNTKFETLSRALKEFHEQLTRFNAIDQDVQKLIKEHQVITFITDSLHVIRS